MAMLAASAAIIWMALTWLVGESGVLREFERNPSPLMQLLIAVIILSVFIAFSHLGRLMAMVIPLYALIGIQAFRLPLAICMHTLYERGIMLSDMTYSGRNFDIVTGVTAIVVALLVATNVGGRKLVWAWNAAGLGLLLHVVVLAVFQIPDIAFFNDGQLNIWVTDPPFVWLPAVMVLAALAGHLIIFRALIMPAKKDG